VTEAAPGALVERPPDSLWDRIRAEPERAPEHVALAASERFAEPARRWAEHAGREPADLAREARRTHVRLARLEGAALGLGGVLTAVPDLGALAWIQSRMVFFVAAAYGFDPAHPMRPAELLALAEIYDTPAAAREALDGLGTPLAVQMLDAKLRSADDRHLTRRLLQFAGRRVARRYVTKGVPLISSPIASVQNGRATAELGDRAIRYYGG
jgi:hypothetical protein